MSEQISLSDYNARKIELLPILAAQQLVLLPLYFFIPLWITLLNLIIVSTVYLTDVRQKFSVHPRIKNIITLVAVAGILFSFHKLTGRDAGVALIATMYGLKIMEIKSQRDVYILMLLGFFILLASFLFDQSPGIAIYQFIPVAAILNALTSIHSLSLSAESNAGKFKSAGSTHSILHHSFKATIRQLLKYLTLSIPLMIILFVFFPRLAGPIWRMPGGASAISGISDTMSPGEISSLQLFDKIAFRVKFKGDTPTGSNLYWRTLVLGEFDGLTWSREKIKKEQGIATFVQSNRTSSANNSYDKASSFYRYDISLEKTKQRWLTFLDRPVDIPKRARLFSDYSVQIDHRLLDRTRYQAESQVGLRLDGQLSLSLREKNTRLPEDGNPRSIAWARQQRQSYPTDRAFIEALLLKINQQEYFYTLSPPIMQRDTVDSFWFDEQKGFCEHYAGALVFMARAANVPARVVIGYQGAEKNPLSDYWIVRYANAHAWTEIWFENEGWLRVDPTAAIAPHRIEKQLQTDYRQRDSLFGDFGFDAVELDDIGWLKQFEYWMDQANNGWNEWILDYNKDSQKKLFDGLGLENLTGQQVAILMIGMLGAFLTLVSIRWVSDKEPLDPVQASLQLLLKKLNKHDIELQDNQGINALIGDIRQKQQHNPTIETATMSQLIRILKLYLFLRYQRQEITQKQQNYFRQQVKSLRIRSYKSN
jgi:transglutaminase-like putative cysteine protease